MTEPERWVGYLEHRTPELLGIYTANAGKGYCTIFAEQIRQRQRRNLQGLPWCATFVHAIFDRPDVLGRAHPGTRVLARRMRRKHLWRGRDYIPRRYDLIFCSTRKDGRISHVGIVTGCLGGLVISIDGNTQDPSGTFRPEQGGAVARRERRLDDPIIVGYAATGGLLRTDKGGF